MRDSLAGGVQKTYRLVSSGGALHMQALESGVSVIVVGAAGASIDGTLTLLGSKLKFPANRAPSTDPTTFDDYREGVWTPFFKGQGGQSGQAYGVQEGTYTKKGRDVNCRGRLTLSTLGTFGAGPIFIGGLPFPCALLQNAGTVTVGYYGSFVTAITMLGGFVQLGQDYAWLWYAPAAGTGTMIALAAGMMSSNSDLMFHIAYQAAD